MVRMLEEMHEDRRAKGRGAVLFLKAVVDTVRVTWDGRRFCDVDQVPFE